MRKPKRKHRPHTPFNLGPRLEFRSGSWTADCRPWKRGRYFPICNPHDDGWPFAGKTTRFRDVAERWLEPLWSWLEQQAHDADMALWPPSGHALPSQLRSMGTATEGYLAWRRWTEPPQSVEWDERFFERMFDVWHRDYPVGYIDNDNVYNLFDRLYWKGESYDARVNYLSALRRWLQWLGLPDRVADVSLSTVPYEEALQAMEDAVAQQEAELLRQRELRWQLLEDHMRKSAEERRHGRLPGGGRRAPKRPEED